MSGDNGQFSAQHLKKMMEGVRLYNQGKFWECHEELEDHWLADMGDDARYVYWVVIQVATALYHHADGNLAGAKGMLNKAKEKILQCERRQVESDIMNKFLAWKRFKKLVKEVPNEPILEDFLKLKEFRFSDPDKWSPHLEKLEC
jgi:predicted metal-dependent hydrolase